MRLVRFASIVRFAPALIATLAFLHPAAAQEKTMPTITVVGEGIATAVSDLAVISVGVVAQAARAADALAQNSKAMTDVIAAVKEAGIEPRDVETSRVSLRPQYSQPSPGSREAPKLARLRGEQYRVDPRTRARQGGRRARSAGYRRREPDPQRRTHARGTRTAARQSADRGDEGRAAQRLQLLADAAGVRIVRLFSVVEDFSEAPRPLMRMSAEAAASRPSVPIEAGEQEIRGRVTAVFEIAPK